MKKIFLFFSILLTNIIGFSQVNPALDLDPDINIVMNGPSTQISLNQQLQIKSLNNGFDIIPANSLVITITVGSNAEIVSMATLDSKWVIATSPAGNGNIWTFTNTSPIGDGEASNFLMNVKGKVISTWKAVNGHINFILTPPPSDLPGNNNSTTSLAVTPLLAVNLLSFNGTTNACSANLTWNSASEINFDKYELQKSADGITFNSINTQLGKGYAASYNFNDESASIIGKVFYRLKLIDKDGTIKYSSIVNLNLNCKNDITTIIYPNPTFDVLNIKCSAEIQKLELFNAEGQLVYTQTLKANQNKINVLKYAAGIYLLRVSTSNQIKTYRVTIK